MASKNEQKIQEIVDAMTVPGIIGTGAGNKITGNQIASRISSIPRRTGFNVNNTQYRLNIKAEAGYYPSGITYPIDIFTGSTNVTPAAKNIILSTSHKYLNGDVTVRGDPNLIPSNIKAGTYIFGVYGTYTGSSTSIQYATGHISLAQNSYVCLTEIVAGTSNINVLELNGVNGSWNIPINTILTIVWNNTAPPYYNNGLRLISSSGQSAPRAFVFSVQSDFTLTE